MAAPRPDLPPTRTIEPIAAPPDSAEPTTAQLKADIDSGRTGDKTEVFDPGLSPLGTDDEAAGTPASPERIALARRTEGPERWRGGGEKASDAHRGQSRALPLFLGFIVLAAIVLACTLWLR
ncbi:hypothetical protein OPKNFCMD_0236 [Methylobacterium crusticola]|uniref:Uncharacterized protein n=1 Tax=Methylobacterium crusticola TaxID=1697972 RepID=A0ABQ4QQG7_9HYPH|nr:hypothetical protein [Methylobacterium crusticola]GJD47528.1 hypothetical protein OPKNFCMD_0236 [Methylobacterium crusticola]